MAKHEAIVFSYVDSGKKKIFKKEKSTKNTPTDTYMHITEVTH